MDEFFRPVIGLIPHVFTLQPFDALHEKESTFRVLSFSVLSDLRPRLQHDRRIEIQLILVVLPTAQPLVLLMASKKPQHMKIRKMVLDTFQRRQR